MRESHVSPPMAAARRTKFEADIEQLGLRGGSAQRDARNISLGIAVMVLGLAITGVTFVVSGSIDDSRDVMSAIILAVFGLGIVVIGAVVYLRYALGEFFRLWLLRLIAEQRSVDDE